MPTVTCSCPHCARIVPYLAKCANCKGTLTFRDFNKRIREICELERIWKLQDPRAEGEIVG